MSDEYQTRLRWERGRGGVATLHGVTQRLDSHICPVEALPAICILIDYTPEDGVALTQCAHAAKRDLNPAEVRACDRLLRTLCAER